MTLNQFFKSKSKDELEAIAKQSQTTYENLQQIFMYGGSVSTGLAIRIAKSTNGDLKASALKPELSLLESEVA